MTNEEAIEVLKINYPKKCYIFFCEALDMAIEALSQSKKEILTDTEKRIFLSAMGRERRVCEQLEKESAHIPADRKIPLIPIVDEIERKVKTVLWRENNGSH